MYKIKSKPEDFIVEEIPVFENKKSGKYTYFLLEKRNYNTEKVIQKLSRYYNIPRKRFGYAGSKDKRAVTKQYCSVKGRIKAVELNDISVKVVGYGDEPISLGDLSSNKFTITIRNVTKKPKPITFIINYFDEQRFGKNNLEAGLAILKKDFKKASGLLQVKVKNNDYIGAIRTIPLKTLRLIINSVQSYLWNEIAADYIKVKTKTYSEVKYKHGIFIFPKNRLNNIEIPLIAFDTEFDNNEIRGLYVKILKKTNLSLKDFVIRSLPNITPLGNKRNLITDVKKVFVGKLENDDLNKNKKKVTVNFELSKGSYATLVIKKMFL